MKAIYKAIIIILLMETFVLYLMLTKTPEVTLKATDHVSCNQTGFVDRGPVEVRFQLGPVDHRTLTIKTEAASWAQAEAICKSWNDIGAELEK